MKSRMFLSMSILFIALSVGVCQQLDKTERLTSIDNQIPLPMKKYKDAPTIFTIATTDYPQSYNAFDSLGEACMKNGDTQSARKYYERSLELNPNNKNAVEMLKSLK